MIHSQLVEKEQLSGVKVQIEGSQETIINEFAGIIEALLQHDDLVLLTLECMVQVVDKHSWGDNND